MSDSDANIHISPNQKLKVIIDYIGELSTKHKTQSSSSDPITLVKMQNQPLIPLLNQPPIPPPNPLAMHLPRTLKELVALTLDQ